MLKKEDFSRTRASKGIRPNQSIFGQRPYMAPPRHGQPMKLYISASGSTIGNMLAQDDENGAEKVVYYLS